MILKTTKGTQLRPLANGETLTVKTKGKEIKIESSLCKGVYNNPLYEMFKNMGNAYKI